MTTQSNSIEPPTSDGVIAYLPDLQVEVSHIDDAVILQQIDYSGESARLTLHRLQVRLIAEHFGLLPELSASAAAQLAAEQERTRRAEAMVKTLQRRMRALTDRIEQLDDWLCAAPDYDRAYIHLEVQYSAATWDIAREFCADFNTGAAPVFTPPIKVASTPPSAAPKPPLAAAPKPPIGEGKTPKNGGGEDPQKRGSSGADQSPRAANQSPRATGAMPAAGPLFAGELAA